MEIKQREEKRKFQFFFSFIFLVFNKLQVDAFQIKPNRTRNGWKKRI